MNWPWRRKPKPTPHWAREVVATIPLQALPDHILTFADCVRKTSNAEMQERHWQKLYAACRRLEAALSEMEREGR